ncbi:MAG: protein-L-isoaspartate O-methyltransferase [Methanomassiliicoccales archaeon]|jgi:protein-L-isoaspartate(D-aspartate) O-methyltransferase|nr:protein-L-isoaspartate O-methyltransferase [Methanomassiliicoccales archaeon]
MDFDIERKRMIRSLVEKGYLTKPDVIKAMEKVPRHLFVPEGIRRSAYIDTPLSIGEGQTISAPHMVAIMVEALDLRPGMKVLEVGGGSGYHAAVMGEIVRPDGHVYSVERIESLAERAKKNLKEAGYDDIVTIVVGDGSKGLGEFAPFDRICVAAAAPGVPEPLKQQLADDGKLLIPVGGRWYQDLILVERKQNKFLQTNLGGCVFVPLIGEYGYGN